MKKITAFWAKHETAVAVAFLLLAVAMPWIIKSPYIMNIVIVGLIFSVLSLSLNLVTGFLGQVTLGHAAFYGVGAYTAAILSTRAGLNFGETVFLAGIMAALFGLLLGLPTLRLNGNYLAIATMAFGEIMRLVELNWMSLTRGPMGIPGIPALKLFGFKFKTPMLKYYLILLILLFAVAVIKNISNSRVGRTFLAIKNDSIAAEAMGVNLFKYKLICFSTSAFIAGIAGAYYAHYMSFIDPSAFAGSVSIKILSMTILGGLASIPGSIIGAMTLTAVPELLRSLAEKMALWGPGWEPISRGLVEGRQIIYGIILVIMVLVKSDGLLGGINLKHIRQSATAENTARQDAGEKVDE